MQVKLSREQFLKTLTLANDVVSSKNVMSILSNILLKAENGRFVVSASDTETHILVFDDAEIIEEGTAVLPSKKLMDIVKNMPQKDNIILKKDEKNIVNISTDSKLTKAKFKLNGMSEEDFITLPKIDDVKSEDKVVSFKLTQAFDLKNMFYKTVSFISKDSIQGNTCGVCVEMAKDKLIAVATDARKLAYVESQNISPEIEGTSIIVPEKIINLFIKTFDDSTEISVEITRSMIFFYSDNIVLSSRLIDGMFPDYRQVIPAKFDKNVTISLSRFSQAVKRVSSIMDINALKVLLEFTGNSLKLVSVNNEVGNAEEDIEIQKTDFQDFKIYFSWQMLQEAIKIMTKPNINLSFNSETSAAMIRDEGTQDSYAIIMPFRGDN